MPSMYDMLKSNGDDDTPKKPRNGDDPAKASKKLIDNARKFGVDNEQSSKELYLEALATVRTLLDLIRSKLDANSYMERLHALLDKLFNQLILGDSILTNVYKGEEKGYYLPYHIVNMLILSSFLGLKMGFNKSRMRELGMACVFCDVGLDELRDIVDQPTKLSDEDYSRVKNHIYISLSAVEKIDRISRSVKDAILTHHERIDGSGYPKNLRSVDMSVEAKIIGLVDTYEAISHRRSYREGVNAHKTIRLLLSSLKGSFDHDAMKLLVNNMSVYPIGTIVELDTGDIARVIGVKPGSPLRPIVMLIQDMDGNIMKETKIIDLSQENTPSIINSL